MEPQLYIRVCAKP